MCHSLWAYGVNFYSSHQIEYLLLGLLYIQFLYIQSIMYGLCAITWNRNSANSSHYLCSEYNVKSKHMDFQIFCHLGFFK